MDGAEPLPSYWQRAENGPAFVNTVMQTMTSMLRRVRFKVQDIQAPISHNFWDHGPGTEKVECGQSWRNLNAKRVDKYVQESKSEHAYSSSHAKLALACLLFPLLLHGIAACFLSCTPNPRPLL